MMSAPDQLLFVYNADGGVFAMLADAVHKVASPDTYPCSLCAITYGAVSMKREWRDYLKRLPVAPRFHHRDDFARAWPAVKVALPAILLRRGGGAPELLVDAATLDRQPDIAALIVTLEAALARTGSATRTP